MKPSGFAVAAGVLLLTIDLPARQQTAPSPQFKAGVDLVQIDVVALDKDGHPVRGLTAADFTLTDRKKPQSIATFKEVTIGAAAAAPALTSPTAVGPVASVLTTPDVASNQTPAPDRLVVLVLDDYHVYRGLADRARALAHKVATALGPQSTIAVLFTSGRRSIDFTRDPDAVSAAIDSFTPTQIGRRPGPASDEPRDPPKKDPLGPPPPYDEKRDLSIFAADEALPKTLDDAARLLLTTDARRKAFVLISESTAADLRGWFQGYFSCQKCLYRTAMENAVKSMERANVTLYAFDPRGAVKDADIAEECAPGRPGPLLRDPCVGDIIRRPEENWIRYAQTGLDATAEATGGFAVTNTDDFAAGLDRLLQNIDHYYLLGFSPTDPKGAGFRPVSVTVNHPGITLHYRRGYVLGGEDVAPANVDPLVAMSSSILPRTDLPLRLTATATGPGPSTAKSKPTTRVVAIIEATLPNAQAPELRYGMLAVDLDSGKEVVSEVNSVTLTQTQAGTRPGTSVNVAIPMELALPPGRYQLRASGLSAGLEKGGSVYLQVDVPDFSAGRLILGVPVLGSSEEASTFVAHGTATATLPFTPTLDRAFAETAIVNLFCPLAHRPGSTPAVTIDVATSDGHLVDSVQPDPLAAPGDLITAQFSLATLSTGTYTLRIRATDGSDTAERRVAIAVK